MNELIQINERLIGDDTIQAVNARDLHAFLEVGKDFSNWIKDRIEQYKFVENQDFVIFAETGENSGRGRPAKEYVISLDMAKELAMVERATTKASRQGCISSNASAVPRPVHQTCPMPLKTRPSCAPYYWSTRLGSQGARARAQDEVP